MTDILWLMPPNGYSERVMPVVNKHLRTAGLPASSIMFSSLHHRVQNLVETRGKKKIVLNPMAVGKAHEALTRMCETVKPKVIVVNDLAALWLITKSDYSLDVARGSVYYYKGIPVIPVNQMQNLFTVNEARWVLLQDLAKIRRWASGKQKSEPQFDLTICRSVGQVQELEALARTATAMSSDIETGGGVITCIGYTLLIGQRLRTFVVPFYNPLASNGCFWGTVGEELAVWGLVRAINASDCIKVLQNGTYDSAWLIRFGAPYRNFICDTSNLMHSIWMEAPKKLNFIASIGLDYCRYWKDENKGEKEDKWGEGQISVERYWRYNGLDCHNTMLCAAFLLSIYREHPWVAKNYDVEFGLSVGPCLAMSMRGMKRNIDRHSVLMFDRQSKHEQALAKLKIMVDNDDFNVRSSEQVAVLLYDILGAKQTRMQRKGGKYGPRSTDEKVLARLKEQPNPFLSLFIEAILETKKPLADISKYGDANNLFWKGRFYSWLNPAATDTGRFGGGGGQFWTGTNPQNIPPEIKEIMVADAGYVFFEIDYSASDDWFIAYEADEPAKQELLKSGKDGHAFHASVFFKHPYEKVVHGKKNHEEWCVHPTKGVRSNSKRVVHGRNFGMEAGTMYNTMGREALVYTAAALGFKKPGNLTEKELIGICDQLIDKYDHPVHGLYKRLRPWRKEAIERIVKNGNIVSCAGERTRIVFADLANDHNAQRAVIAFFGQGGTASNINSAMLHLHYGHPAAPDRPSTGGAGDHAPLNDGRRAKLRHSGLDDGQDLMLLQQTHDSLMGQVRKDKLHLIRQVQDIMERPIKVNGQMVRVPTEASVGLTWSKEEMLGYKEGVTYADVVAFEKKKFEAKYSPDKILQLLTA